MNIDKTYIEEIYKLIVDLHEDIIKNSGGIAGIRDQGGLYNSLYKILLFRENNKDNPPAVAALIYEELARRHHFNDGNKRTAHAVAKIILYLMRNHLKIKYRDAVPVIIGIAQYESKIKTNQIKFWVKNHITIVEEKNLEKYIKEILFDISNDK